MTTLAPGMTLRVATPLTIRLHGDGIIRIATPDGRQAAYGTDVLAILGSFAVPRELAGAAALVASASKGLVAYTDAMSTIVELVGDGVLVEPDHVGPASPVTGYEDPSTHVAMLADRSRTLAFVGALRRTITAGDVVVDLGTGSGILAVAAAQAGAEHVYAIEASGIADTAQRVIDDNGVADRVTVVRGWSTAVELPERASVFVSEMIGHDALGERVLEVTLDARRRFLLPGARMIPSSVTLMALIAKVPDDTRERFAVDRAGVDRWRQDYGVDLAALRALTDEVGNSRRAVEVATVGSWDRLAAPAPIATIDLSTFEGLGVSGRARVTVERSGRVDAVAVCWGLEVDEHHRVSTEPGSERDTHWRVPVWFQFEPIEVGPGDQLDVTYRYRAPGSRDGVTVALSSSD